MYWQVKATEVEIEQSRRTGTVKWWRILNRVIVVVFVEKVKFEKDLKEVKWLVTGMSVE